MNEKSIELPPKAKRVLDVTRELLLRRGSRGLTIAEIASLANVGKGTLYQYWATKEELLIELFIHDFLAQVKEIERMLADDPTSVLPHKLFPALHRTKLKHPFIVAAQTKDHELLRLVEAHPAVRTLLDTISVRRLVANALTVLRGHGLTQDNLTLGEQIYVSLAMLEGVFQLPQHPDALPSAAAEVDGGAMLDVVARQLLEPKTMPQERAIAEAAASVRGFMRECHRAALTHVLSSRRATEAGA